MNSFLKRPLRAAACCLASIVPMALFPATAGAVGGFGFQRIVNTAITVPPSELPTAQYEYVGIPAIAGGTIAFGAKQTGVLLPGGGLFTRIDVGTTAGALTQYAKSNPGAGPNPPFGNIDFFFDDPAISGGLIAARPSAYDGTNYRGQAWVYSAPHVSVNHGVAWGPPALSAPTPVFPANRVGLNVTQLFNTLLDVNDFVPGGGGAKFHNFSPIGGSLGHQEDPHFNGEYAAFLARWTDASNVIRIGLYRWQKSTDTIVAVADKNVSIPGFPLDKFDDNFSFYTTSFDNVSTTGATGSARPSVAGSTVAFAYDEITSSPARAGVYRYAGSSLAKIADVTTINPATSTNFRHFEGVSTVGSATAFVANSVPIDNSIVPAFTSSIGSNYGLYLVSCGQIQLVAKQGGTLDGRTISNLELGHRGLSTAKFSYNLAFRAEFTDGSEGVYVATTSSLCFDPIAVLDVNHVLFNASTAFVAADPDIGTPVGSNWQMTARSGVGSVIEAALGADFETGAVGIDSLPGNNPALIDFTLDAGGVAPEELALSFDHELLLEGLALGSFDPEDSLVLTLGGTTRLIVASDLMDGVLPLHNVRLPAGETIRIAWDPNNSVGDGVSWGGLGYQVVPEPSALLLALMTTTYIRVGRSCPARRSSSQPAVGAS